MADQCIVCLEVLEVEPTAAPPSPPSTSTSTSASGTGTGTGTIPAAASALTNPIIPPTLYRDNVAQIQICGHVLHEACLREWSEKANSCPICRQTFHTVHVYDKVGGTRVSSHEVEDKKQVAEFDHYAWIADNPEVEEEDNTPCPVCNRADNEETLLLCDACDTPYHTYCMGLDEVPSGHWFCIECEDTFGSEVVDAAPPQNTSSSARRSNQRYYMPRTQASMRRARQRARSDEWQGAWGRIAGRVWDALSIDLDYQEDDDHFVFENLRRTQQLRQQERQEHEHWQQRLNIASRQGARDVFATHIPEVFHGRPWMQSTQVTRDEERRAWGALERARELQDTAASRKRKSRSGTAEPSEAQQEPERKLKRPRTRRLPPQNGESSSAAENIAPPSNHAEPAVATPTEPAPGSAQTPAPSFLSSLLKEVEMSTPSDEQNLRSLFGPIPSVNDVSSPVLSPSSPSGYSSPRALSLTPPPNHAAKRASPQMTLSSHISPIYPPANFSPTRSLSPRKDSRSSSPTKNVTLDSRSSPENSDSEPRGRQNGGLELRQPRPRRARPVVLPRSENVSPARNPLPLELKANISNIVRDALRPLWQSHQLTADQYASINRDVSRKIYEEVKDPALVPENVKQRWEKMASNEVARAVAELKV
ncbi:hypothetical protein B0T22DRAFT_418856 [Podospora appendiculata]|uniref:PHD and RING finger domain-containing protein n=1 Tax=Podospora appendiculata TaxID=314037 RepID=A0AAE0XF00_9PEZI|nr:hypothetical protein B0T22DRAFT_418856 [Podospora appendiculata]